MGAAQDRVPVARTCRQWYEGCQVFTPRSPSLSGHQPILALCAPMALSSRSEAFLPPVLPLSLSHASLGEPGLRSSRAGPTKGRLTTAGSRPKLQKVWACPLWRCGGVSSTTTDKIQGTLCPGTVTSSYSKPLLNSSAWRPS